MPTKPTTRMATHDGNIRDTGAVQKLRESDGKRVPSENVPRPKTKPVMPGGVKAK